MAHDFTDIWNFTYPDYERLKYTDLKMKWQECTIWRILFQKAIAENPRDPREGPRRRIVHGDECKFNLKTGKADTATNPAIDAADVDFDAVKLFDKGVVPWAALNAHTAWYDEEAEMNGGDKMMVDVIKSRVRDMHVNIAEKMEDQCWRRGDAANSRVPRGINQYIVVGGVKGFTGANPAGFATCAGLDTSLAAYEKYRNYYYPIAGAVTVRKLVDAIREARWQIGWKTIVALPNLNRQPRQVAYTDWQTKELLAQAARETVSTNFDLGITMKGDNVYVDGLRIVPVHSYDPGNTVFPEYADLYPIFLVDWGTWDYRILSGFNFKTYGPRRRDAKHLKRRVDTDARLAVFCTDRKRNALILAPDEQT